MNISGVNVRLFEQDSPYDRRELELADETQLIPRIEEWLDTAAEAAKADDAVLTLVVTVQPTRRRKREAQA